jgi:hypothetical protein
MASFVIKSGGLDIFVPNGANQIETHEHQEQELNVIFKLSPFKTIDALKQEFDRIQVNGTCIVLYNIFMEAKHTCWTQ